ncbi:netrin receptor UNC5C-like [Stylophora pistillata]|uniref:netrin receptor UNC5C-like n=1 Tax=Stylophora pistillata TaxID=50429 RepID=UPI000C04336B|nr:netrin receptor UNC5C-like [Stylophora pistillata]
MIMAQPVMLRTIGIDNKNLILHTQETHLKRLLWELIFTVICLKSKSVYSTLKEFEQLLTMETFWVCIILILALSSGGCQDQILDIAILADVSRSMNSRQRSDKIKLIDELVEKKGVSPSGNHFAVITFAKEDIIESNFNDESYHEEDKLKHFVQKTVSVRPKAWGTRTDLIVKFSIINMPKIDGGYTEWSESTCSVSCGGGEKSLTRTCTNPPPSNGGKDCSELGSAEKTVSCNEAECPEYFIVTLRLLWLKWCD